MLALMTIIAAVLDLTVVIQRLALGGIHMLGLGGFHHRALPASPQQTQNAPAERTAVPIYFHTTPMNPITSHFVSSGLLSPPVCPLTHLSATCPAQPNDDKLSTATTEVASPGQALIVWTMEATDLSWLGSEAVDFEVPDDFVVSWTGDLLPHTIIYCDFPPPMSVALFEPQPSDMDFDWFWIYLLGFIVSSLLFDAAVAELQERFVFSFSIVLSFPDISFDFSPWTNLLSGIKNRISGLGIQAIFSYHLSLLRSSRLASHTRTFHQHPYPTTLRIWTTGLLGRLRILRQSSFGVSELPHVQLWLDSSLDSTWIYVYSGIWEHDPDASMLLCFGLVVWILYRVHTRHNTVMASNKKSNDHAKKVLRDGLQLITRYGSLRLTHLRRKLDSAHQEAASIMRIAGKLFADKQALEQRMDNYTRTITSQLQENKELKSSLEKAEAYNLAAVRLRRAEYARTGVRIQQLELDNDNYRSQCAEFKSALEEERATIVSLRAQLSSRRSPIMNDSCTQTSPEVDVALARQRGYSANGAESLGLYPADSAPDCDSCAHDTESLVYGTDAADLGLEDDPYDSDSDMSECSVVRGTIFIPYNPNDDASDSCESDDSWFDDDHHIPDPPAIDAALHEASRSWTQYATTVDKQRLQEIEARDSIISQLKQRLEKTNESWDFKLSQAQFMAAALRERIEVLEARIKADTPLQRDSVSPRSHGLESSTSSSTVDLSQIIADVSLLQDVSYPQMPHWPSEISFGDRSFVQGTENTNVGSLEGSLPVLTPDHPLSSRTPSSTTTSVLPELAVTPDESDVTTAEVANDSDAVEFNAPFTPCPVRPSAGKNGDGALFQPGLPSWSSFASEISASAFTSSPMDVMGGSPAVNSPIDLPALPSPSSFDQSFSPSPLAARVKHGNADRSRQPLLSPLNINRSP
ncbi:hypothetical protein DENSPDRAFT_541609 [Dentipellis sp. KUC8613]|nr:hypothetical protein DENSPDRAFT_541609 [Dentipellis sp. KUC8613]